MHNKEAIKYAACAIVDLLANDKKRYYKNSERAARLSNYKICGCGGTLIKCSYANQDAEICFECGQIFINGSMVRKCNVRRIKAC
ncbi:hypothetical protein ABG79_02169 [Caloramator mitchellensis]|uniref:Uncharacterized protein n=1 Tax=Caloramator mitchellensis TaxID=908809 RepID=A0A0R3JZL4_CALMK|nr:hypothetical protein [Caloramator mitchellensis]KRQ86037.1 hypothetical protein ABG79_02169 [Caloramator mitchellensis]